MANNLCTNCGYEIQKNSTRCLNCEEVKYQAELNAMKESKEAVKKIAKPNPREMIQNAKNRTRELREARLDSALAWGAAIASMESDNEETIYEDSAQNGNFCSNCGMKINFKDVYCANCGTNLRSNSSNLRDRGSDSRSVNIKKPKSKMFRIVVLLFSALLGIMVISQVFNNSSPNIETEDNPKIVEPSPEGKLVSKCRLITIPNPNAPGRLKDQIESGLSPTITVQSCTDVYVQPVDTDSREYITGLTIGNNFSDSSDAGANAEEVCATARDRRIVLNSGGGIGVNPKTATFLNSKDGFQGCIDGFNGVPQD